jgi:hypothetical protein
MSGTVGEVFIPLTVGYAMQGIGPISFVYSTVLMTITCIILYSFAHQIAISDPRMTTENIKSKTADVGTVTPVQDESNHLIDNGNKYKPYTP